MRAVAAASGLNVATLYHYFPSKRDLLPGRDRLPASSDHALAFPFPEGLAGTRRGSARRAARPLLRRHDATRPTSGARSWPRRSTATTTCSSRCSTTADAVRSRARRRGSARCAPTRPRCTTRQSCARSATRSYGVMVEHLPQPEGRRGRARRARQGARVPCSPRSGDDDDCRPRPTSSSTRSTRRCSCAVSRTTCSTGCASNDPVHWDERNNLWVISKYEDVSYVERQPELFCSGQGIRPKGGGAGNLSIVSLDDPEHARQRRLVSRGFTPSRINQMFDHIRELARGLVDSVAARGECDFVEDIAEAAAAHRHRGAARLARRGPPAARRVVRHDDERRRCRGRHRSAAAARGRRRGPPTSPTSSGCSRTGGPIRRTT